MPAELRQHGLGDVARILERERRVGERRVHLLLREPAERAVVPLGRRIVGLLVGELAHVGTGEDLRARLLRQPLRVVGAALLDVEQHVRRAHLLGRREARALDRIELFRPRLVTGGVGVEFGGRRRLDALDHELRKQPIDLELHAQRGLGRCVELRRARLRRERLLHEHAHEQVVHAARVVREAGAQVGRELQQLGVVLGARDLGAAVGNQHDVVRAGLGDRRARKRNECGEDEPQQQRTQREWDFHRNQRGRTRPRSGRKRGEDCSSPQSAAVADAIT